MSGQRFGLQERYLTRTPWQYLPPFDGTGLLHSLLDSWTPPPHVREQDPNGPHLPQRPSTWKHTNQQHVAEGLIQRSSSLQGLRFDTEPCVGSYLPILGLFIGTDSSVADLSIAAVGAVGPGEVSGHTHQVAVGLSCAPQTAARRLHEGTGLGVFTKSQLTLTFKHVGRSGEQVRER